MSATRGTSDQDGPILMTFDICRKGIPLHVISEGDIFGDHNANVGVTIPLNVLHPMDLKLPVVVGTCDINSDDVRCFKTATNLIMRVGGWQ